MEIPFLDAAKGSLELLEEFQEGIWIADNHGRIVFANRALARLIGYDGPEALADKPWPELFPAGEAARLTRLRPDAGTRTVDESSILATDSRQVPVTIALFRRTVDEDAWCIGSVLPAAPPKPKVELTESASRQVVDNSVDGVCIVEDGRVVYANRRFEELTGYTASQVSHLGFDRLVAQKDRATVTEVLSDARKILAPVHHEIRVINRSGHELDCELRIVPTESNGRTTLLCFLRDVSELRQAERVRTDFIAMVSHDLRTPLAAIKEAMSLLSETAANRLEDRQRRYLTIAREEIDRLNRMVDNLVEVSRMDSGKVVLRFDAVDLPELLSTAIESLSLLISKRNLIVERNIPSRLPPVMGDRDRLLRVFNNVLDNAIKYTPRGGTIRVDIGLVDPGATVLTERGILSNTGYLRVTVSDDGPGIPAEFLDRIFGKFERVDPHGPGIGLGLAIVRSIIEMHYGKVWAESNLGEGAKFSFILPIKENA
jgi:two-component system phosphate regulon sensor histidine kinase PhoR